MPIRTALATSLLAVALTGGSSSARTAADAVFVVNTYEDAPHTLPVDGNCTSTLSGNPCTLRAAVQAVNFLGGAGTITLPAGTFSVTVAGADEDAGASGDLDIITGGVTIQGDGSATTVIDAAGLGDRVFDLQPGTAADLSRMTIQNGAPGIADGGAVRVQAGATLTVTNGTLTQNLARNRRGGAIFNDGATTLTDTTLTGNSTGTDLNVVFPFSGEGGGVYNAPNRTLTVNGGILSANRSADGGGLFNAAGTTELSATTFQENRARNRGGGIFNQGMLTGAGLTVTSNQAGDNNLTGGEASGGGFYNTGTVTLSTSTVSANRLNAPTESQNRIQGAGLYNGAGAIAGLRGTLVSGNLTNRGVFQEGFGIYNAGTLSATNVTVTDNRPSNFLGTSSTGSALFNSGGSTATLLFVTIARNAVGSTSHAQVHNAGALQIGSSIVAYPLGLNAENCSGAMAGASVGHNIDFPLDFGESTCAFTAIGDQAGVDPMLGSLANNGGPTQTIALLPMSPAIDAADPACPPPATDQRGFVRPGGARCDIGAFEVPFTDEPLVSSVSFIRAVHIHELRTRIDALRSRFGLSGFSWTDGNVSGLSIKAIHITELREALASVYEREGSTPPTYTDSPLVPGVTIVRVEHIAELRAAVIAIE
jgi:CSLREA domain-containing protein